MALPHLSRNLPAGHSCSAQELHPVEPDSTLNCPVGQSVHVPLAPAPQPTKILPAGHVAHATQGVFHVPPLPSDLYEPPGQATHFPPSCVAQPSRNSPAGQASHCLHTVLTELPSTSWYSPLLQGVHVPREPSLHPVATKPRSHDVQSLQSHVPASDRYCPDGQNGGLHSRQSPIEPPPHPSRKRWKSVQDGHALQASALRVFFSALPYVPGEHVLHAA